MVMAGLLAAVFGAGQFFLNTKLFGAVFGKKPLKALLPLLLKLLLYGGGFALLFFVFREYLVGACIGFGVGFFPGIFICGIPLLRGGEKNDTEGNY